MKKILFAFFALLGIAPAQAADYPTRPITMIVPFAAGGPTDVVARIAGEYMSQSLGQQIVIENIAGAGGTTGITRGAQSKNDGYTIMMGHMGTHGAAKAVYPKLKYDPVKDFAPIGIASGTPIVVVSRKTIPANNLKEFTAWLKANEKKVNEAHAGVGSVSYTTCSLFNKMIGLSPTRVTYRGTGPIINDMLAGKVDYACDQIVNLVPQIKAGNIKAYAIATPKRSPALPDVPTTTEAGMPAFQVSAWNALFAPKGTPKDVVAKLSQALDKALSNEAARKRLHDLGGVIPEGSERTPEHLGKFVAEEVARWDAALKGSK
ncbi:MAG: hypothetical protein RL477_1979 [Pseudomonadota bacterium]